MSLTSGVAMRLWLPYLIFNFNSEKKCLCEQIDVSMALAEGRDFDRANTQAEIKFFEQLFNAHSICRIAVGRGDKASDHFQFVFTADTQNVAGFKRSHDSAVADH